MDENEKKRKQGETPKSDAAGAAKLRDDIDRGGAGDKVAFSDPAASPLGTDAEAGGHPPTREQVDHARTQENRRAEGAPRKPAPGDLHGGSTRNRFGGAAVAIAVGALILILVFLFF